MYFSLLLVLLHMTCQSSAANAVTIEMDAEPWGAFRSVEHATDHGGAYLLKDGWVRAGFLETWWGESIDAAMLAPGRHVRSPDDCRRRAITISQEIGTGLRQRKQSSTLIDACPVAWLVADEAGSDQKLRLLELSIVAVEVGVAR